MPDAPMALDEALAVKFRAQPLIVAREVTKTFRTSNGEVESLRPLSIEIGAGEFVTIVGPSGCGKTTFLKMVAGLVPATHGEIRIAGEPVQGPQTGVGIVFQNPVLLPWRSVLDNILLQAEMRGMAMDAARQKAAQLIAMAGLVGFEKAYPWQLSGGMQQRAAICRALLHDPAVLLMDEPFGALDAMTREKMNLELQRFWTAAQKTVLLITHSIPEAIFLADRVLVMSERPGSIVAQYAIELPRPRTLEMMGSPEFARYGNAVRGHFYSQGSLDH
jgi:NitT/TauT family transport system ATP-binding protein